jgi:hypothetical protein
MEDQLQQLHDAPAADVIARSTPRTALADPAPEPQIALAALRVGRQALEAFYAGGAKLIIAAADAPRWRNIALPAEIAVLVFGRDGSNGSIDRPGDEAGQAVEPKLPPSDCLAVVALSDEGERDLEALRSWWLRMVRETTPDLIRLTLGSRGDRVERQLHSILLERLLARQRAADTRIVQLQSSLAELRETHEQTHAVLAGLRDVFAGQHVPPLHLALALQPGNATVAPGRDVSEHAVRQRLPVHSQGLAAIAIHLAAPRSRGAGRLQVRLVGVENAATLISWAIPYEHLHSGWNVLEIPSVIAGPRRSVDLILRWTGESRGAPHASLSDQLVAAPACAQIEGGSRLERALAVQVWTGLPGSRVVASAFAQGGEGVAPGGAGRFVHIPVTRFAEARLVQPTQVKLGFEVLSLLDQKRVLQLHPVRGHTSVAALPASCPPGVCLITASVKTDSPQAPPVEYALAWVPAGGAAKLGADGALGGEHVRFSGWTQVPANTVASVLLAIDEGADQPGDLWLATRVPPGSTDAYGWARFLDFRLELK